MYNTDLLLYWNKRIALQKTSKSIQYCKHWVYHYSNENFCFASNLNLWIYANMQEFQLLFLLNTSLTLIDAYKKHKKATWKHLTIWAWERKICIYVLYVCNTFCSILLLLLVLMCDSSWFWKINFSFAELHQRGKDLCCSTDPHPEPSRRETQSQSNSPIHLFFFLSRASHNLLLQLFHIIHII